MLKRMKGQTIAIDAGILFGGFSFRLITQIGWFVMAVRCLGPDGYGAFVSITALTIILSSFVGWGCGSLLIRDVAADAALLRARLGHGLLMIVGTGLVAGALALPALPLFAFARIGTEPLAAILLADLILGRVLELCIAVAMAVGKSERQSLLLALGGLLRLIAVAVAAALTEPLSVADWANWYCAASAAAAALALGLTIRDAGWPCWRRFPGDLWTGLAFSAEGALSASLKDLDKPMVAALVGAEAAGYYAAAVRLVETTLMPINALGAATYGRFFALAAEGHDRSIALGRRLLPAAAGYGVVAGVALLVGADLVPWLFGDRYATLPPLVRLLALLPLAYAVYVLGADVLTSLGHQAQRTVLVGVSLGGTIGLCALVVPTLGADGAAMARVVVQALTAAGVWALVFKGAWPDRR